MYKKSTGGLRMKMNVKRLRTIFLTLFGFFIVFCLAVVHVENSTFAVQLTTVQQSFSNVLLSKSAAVDIARQEVQYRARFGQGSKWKAQSQVVEAYPIYLDGIPGVSYYECKVITGKKDAGYILVNINKNDLLIPESSQEGITLTERYRKMLGREDFAVLRYDWFRSVAVEQQSGPDNSFGEKLADIGFDETSTPRNAVEQFRASVLARGCFPIYQKKDLKTYYNSISVDIAGDHGSGAGMGAGGGGDYRDITAELTNSDWVDREGKKFHTPRWNQFKKPNGHVIGCGPTAWAIVYGYWDKSKGKSRLFKDDWSDIQDCMSECARLTDTRDVYERTKKWAYTPPRNMADAIKYAKNKGYGSSSCKRVQKLNEFNKFDVIYSELNADKPCILMLNQSGFGFPNHYVVVEKATKRQKKKLRGWDDRDVFFTVNYGWGLDSKEIWTREYGVNRHKHVSTFDVYLVDVR
jgi:hypothetical protein